MASFGIMRVEKRKRSAVHGLQLEANRSIEDHEQGRDFDRSDIDWERTQDNIFFKQTKNWNRQITKIIKDHDLKERADSIVMLDGFYGASPEFLAGKSRDEIEKYFRECLDFHIKTYCGGDESLLVNAVIHFDEATPHMQAASVPIIEDEKGCHLSAKIVMGTQREYRRRQDLFFQEVTQKYGLERGKEVEYVPKLDENGQVMKYKNGDVMMVRAADAKVHTTKREWQSAMLDEKIEKQEQTISQNEKTIGDLEEKISDQQKTYEETLDLTDKVRDEYQEIKEHLGEIKEIPLKKDYVKMRKSDADYLRGVARTMEEKEKNLTLKEGNLIEREAHIKNLEDTVQKNLDVSYEYRKKAQEQVFSIAKELIPEGKWITFVKLFNQKMKALEQRIEKSLHLGMSR